MNHMNALTDAQVQPSASRSPIMARRRLPELPAFRACDIVPSYLTVRVPVIDAIGWTVQMKV